MLNYNSYHFLGIFEVKESNGIVKLVIRGQFLAWRSPKGHLRSFPPKFCLILDFSTLFEYFRYLQTHFWDYIWNLHDLPFQKWYSFYFLWPTFNYLWISILYIEYQVHFQMSDYLIEQKIAIPLLYTLLVWGLSEFIAKNSEKNIQQYKH